MWVVKVVSNKNCCDLAGEIIKQWGRVPFIPGPQPPPYKVIRHNIFSSDSSILRIEGQFYKAHFLQKNNRIV